MVPSFYRLKIKTDLEKSSFTGDVYITIKANKKVKEIILHSKNLTIKDNVILTEQIYEKVETLAAKKVKRDIPNNTIVENNNATNSSAKEDTTTTVTNEITSNVSEKIINPTSVAQEITTPLPVHVQVTHSHMRNINITSVTFDSGDRLILSLGSPLIPDVDYTLQIPFAGNIQNSLTGFYKSSYTENNEIR